MQTTSCYIVWPCVNSLIIVRPREYCNLNCPVEPYRAALPVGVGGMADTQHSCSGMHMHPVETHSGVISPFWVGLTKHSPIPFKDFFLTLPPTPVPSAVAAGRFPSGRYDLACHVTDTPWLELSWKIHSRRALKSASRYLRPKVQDAKGQNPYPYTCGCGHLQLCLSA